MIAQQPMLSGATEVMTPFSAPNFSDYQALDARALSHIQYEAGPCRSVALDPKEAFSSSNLASQWEAIPAIQANSGYQLNSANIQWDNLLPGPGSCASQAIDRSNSYAEQSTSPPRPSSGFEQPQQPIPYNLEGSIICEHAQCNGLMFDHLSDWK